mmetsp:Transcript_58154/g.186842  ORF Transcript_58154/g.186842 Transcript_58154/m.186842 type:complete len:451 (+) Transcript_58154:801-2153(+)
MRPRASRAAAAGRPSAKLEADALEWLLSGQPAVPSAGSRVSREQGAAWPQQAGAGAVGLPPLRGCTEARGSRPSSRNSPRACLVSSGRSLLAGTAPAKSGYRAPRQQDDSGFEDQGLARPVVSAVLACVTCQGELDAELEAAQSRLPLGLLEMVFDTVDRFDRGYVSDSDLYQFTQDVQGPPVPYANICALVRDIQLLANTPIGHTCGGSWGLGSSLDVEAESGHPLAWGVQGADHGRFSFRGLALALLAPGSLERAVVERAASDEELRSMLFVLRTSTPCPGCGADAQRDTDASACPLVKCPCCGFVFECRLVGRDTSAEAAAPPAEALQGFRTLVEVAARAAQRLELAREHLGEVAARSPYGAVEPMLAALFRSFAGGRPSMTIGDFRQGLAAQGLATPERVLQVAWQRYARSGERVDFSELMRQLRPRAAAGAWMTEAPSSRQRGRG